MVELYAHIIDKAIALYNKWNNIIVYFLYLLEVMNYSLVILNEGGNDMSNFEIATGKGSVDIISTSYDRILSMPLALTEAPALNTICFAPDSLHDTYIEWTWLETTADYAFLKRGMVYLNQRDAELRCTFDIKLAEFIR